MKTLVCAAALLVAVPAGAADGPAADVPELKELSRFAGTWDSTMTVKDAAGKATTVTGTTTAEWVHGGRFLRQTWANKGGGGLPAMDGSAMYTYDASAKVYRAWMFNSAGPAAEAEGTWDAKANTFTWASKGGPVSTTLTAAFKADGSEAWKMVVKDKDGKVLEEAGGTNTPRKK